MSGGQDSVTCLYWALNRYDEVEVITFDYGQKHKVEIEQAQKICAGLNVKQTIIDISFLNTIVESALTSNGDVNKLNKIGLPSSFVPNRNQLFITLAHALAQKSHSKVLIAGMCETDFSGYPDCRRGFIDAIQNTSNLGSGLMSTIDGGIEIITPLMYLTKAETFELAEQEGCLEQVINDSHTCYNGDREHSHDWGYGCGKCPACHLRAKGYYEYLTLKDQK